MHPTAACTHIYSTCVDFFAVKRRGRRRILFIRRNTAGHLQNPGRALERLGGIGAAAICIVRNWQCFKLGESSPRNLTLSYRFQPRANGERKSSIKP